MIGSSSGRNKQINAALINFNPGFQKSLEKNDQMQPDATDINGNEVDAGSKLPLKRESNTSEEETARDAPPQVETGELNLSESLPIPKIQPSNLSSSDAQHLENENDQPLDDSMTRPLALDDVPNIGKLFALHAVYLCHIVACYAIIWSFMTLPVTFLV